MKKLLLFSLVLCFGFAGISQDVTVNNKFKLAKFDDARINRATYNATNFNAPANIVRSTAALAPTEAQIGTTVYDLFSNFNVGNRFWRFDDGTMAAVFMVSLDPAYADRGTGYNYYDGTEWGPEPTERIETLKTGWPNITAWGTGGEFGFAHNGATGLEFIQRDTKGTGTWIQTNFLGPEGIENDITWPRLICSGENNEYLHMIVNTNGEWEGQARTNLYSRSMDGGATWDPHNVVLPDMGSSDYLEITQDKCVLASKGNTVCILYPNPYSDFFYIRSDDNGENWEKTIIWEHPIPFYDETTMQIDSIFIPDFSGHIAIDNEGHAHVVWGITRYINDASGSGFFAYHPDWNDGIGYWNDMMNRFTSGYNALAPPDIPYVTGSELVVDETYIGWMQDVDGDGVVTLAETQTPIRTYGMCTTPNIHVDEYGRRFVIYSSNTETYVYTGFSTGTVNYKHIWARAYDGGGGWGPFIHLTSDIAHIFDDCVYPMIADKSDDNIHYFYQADITPGNALDGDHAVQDNFWIYGSLPKTDLLTGVAEEIVIEEGNVTQNFPNPFSTTSTVKVTLDNSASLTLEISNLMGQRVYHQDLGQMPAGTHPVIIDATHLDSGVYFYTIKTGTNSVTKRMIVE